MQASHSFEQRRIVLLGGESFAGSPIVLPGTQIVLLGPTIVLLGPSIVLLGPNIVLLGIWTDSFVTQGLIVL